MSFFPLFVLILLDLILITSHLGLKITKKAHKHSLGARCARGTTAYVQKLASLVRRRREPVERFPSLPSIESASVRSFRRKGIGFLSVLYEPDDLEQMEAPPKAESDMAHFVESISKCMSGTRFGLSFEFEDLKYQTRREGKVILSGITGRMDSGTLWGVMGASGAGKSVSCSLLGNIR
jgi:ABC-type multidrug transport system fused ATPase/permease subunit